MQCAIRGGVAVSYRGRPPAEADQLSDEVVMQILKRINGEINRRRKAGEKLPPPPKTAIAGPEYFGFNQAEVNCSQRPSNTYLPSVSTGFNFYLHAFIPPTDPLQGAAISILASM